MKDEFSPSSASSLSIKMDSESTMAIDRERNRYPFCIVWTPIPVLTWLFPFLGHMGICMGNGVIRDFAGSYYVSEDLMAFGSPTKFWQLSPLKATNGVNGWNTAVFEASQIYKKRLHILFYDNCHSHVGLALDLMNYNGCKNWNMAKLAACMFIKGKYVSFGGFMRTWLPFAVIALFLIFVTFLIN